MQGKNTSICHQILAKPALQMRISKTSVRPPHLLRNFPICLTEASLAFCLTTSLFGFWDHFPTADFGISSGFAIRALKETFFSLAFLCSATSEASRNRRVVRAVNNGVYFGSSNIQYTRLFNFAHSHLGWDWHRYYGVCLEPVAAVAAAASRRKPRYSLREECREAQAATP